MDVLKNIDRNLEHYKKKLHTPDTDWPFDIRDALLCINKDLFDPIYSVKTMRERCNISDTNFSSRFRNYVGMTPREYITFHRIRAGMRLLRNENLKHIHVSEIGFTVGYETPSSFTMTFKRCTGLSPREWKRTHLF